MTREDDLDGVRRVFYRAVPGALIFALGMGIVDIVEAETGWLGFLPASAVVIIAVLTLDRWLQDKIQEVDLP